MPETNNQERKEQETREDKIGKLEQSMSPDVIHDLITKSPSFKEVAKKRFKQGSTRFHSLPENKYKVTGKDDELQEIKNKFTNIDFEESDNGLVFDNSRDVKKQISNWAAEEVKNSIIEKIQNNEESIDDIVKSAEILKSQKKEKNNKKIALKSELEEVERNYGLQETKEALDEEKIDKEKAAKKHFKLKFGAFKRAWWKLGNAFGINKGGWEERADYLDKGEQDAVDLEKKVKLRKLMGKKKGWEKASFWNTIGGKDFFRERDKLWKVEELEKMEKNLDNTTKLLGELLSLSTKIEDQQADTLARKDDDEEESESFLDSETNQEEDTESASERLASLFEDEDKNKVNELLNSIENSISGGYLSEESNSALIKAIVNKNREKATEIIENEIDRNDTEEAEVSLGAIIDKINVLIKEENKIEGYADPGDLWEDFLQREGYMEKPDDEDLYRSFFEREGYDLGGDKEFSTKKDEGEKKRTESHEKPKTSGGEEEKASEPKREADSDKRETKSFEEFAKEMVEKNKWKKGKFVKNEKDTFVYRTDEKINGKQVVYTINRKDVNLNAGRIEEGEEYYFAVSKFDKDNKKGKKGEDWFVDENNDQIVYAVYIKLPKETENNPPEGTKQPDTNNDSEENQEVNPENLDKNEAKKEIIDNINDTALGDETKFELAEQIQNNEFDDAIARLKLILHPQYGEKKIKDNPENVKAVRNLIIQIENLRNIGNNDKNKGDGKPSSKGKEKRRKQVESGQKDKKKEKPEKKENKKNQLEIEIDKATNDIAEDLEIALLEEQKSQVMQKIIFGGSDEEVIAMISKYETPDNESIINRIKNRIKNLRELKDKRGVGGAVSSELSKEKEAEPDKEKEVFINKFKKGKIKGEDSWFFEDTSTPDRKIKWVVHDESPQPNSEDEFYDFEVFKRDGKMIKFGEEDGWELFAVKLLPEKTEEKDFNRVRPIVLRGLQKAEMEDIINDVIEAMNKSSVDELKTVIDDLKEKRKEKSGNDKGIITKTINAITREYPDLKNT